MLAWWGFPPLSGVLWKQIPLTQPKAPITARITGLCWGMFLTGFRVCKFCLGYFTGFKEWLLLLEGIWGDSKAPTFADEGRAGQSRILLVLHLHTHQKQASHAEWVYLRDRKQRKKTCHHCKSVGFFSFCIWYRKMSIFQAESDSFFSLFSWGTWMNL